MAGGLIVSPRVILMLAMVFDTCSLCVVVGCEGSLECTAGQFVPRCVYVCVYSMGTGALFRFFSPL